MATPVVTREMRAEIREVFGDHVGFCNLVECPYKGLGARNGARAFGYTCWADRPGKEVKCDAEDPLSCPYKDA